MLYSLSLVRQRLRLAARNGAVTALAVGLFLVGLGFAIALGWMMLADLWDPLVATGATAAGFLLLSVLVLLMRRPTPPEPKAPPPPPPRPDESSPTTILLQA